MKIQARIMLQLLMKLLVHVTQHVVMLAGYVYRLQQTQASNKVPGQVYVCLFVTIALITLRNVYPVIELAVGDAALCLFALGHCMHASP